MNFTIESFSGITLLSGGVLILLAGLFYLFPPKKINWFYGYRSRRSMSSDKLWQFANRYSARLLMIGGGVLAVLGLITLFISPFNTRLTGIAVLVIVITVIILIAKTENRVKREMN